MKVYAFANTKNILASEKAEWVHGVAIAEDGRVVAQHVHTSLAWCRADLSLTGLRRDCILKAVPDAEVEFVEPEAVDTHEGLQAALRIANEEADSEAEDKNNA